MTRLTFCMLGFHSLLPWVVGLVASSGTFPISPSISPPNFASQSHSRSHPFLPQSLPLLLPKVNLFSIACVRRILRSPFQALWFPKLFRLASFSRSLPVMASLPSISSNFTNTVGNANSNFWLFQPDSGYDLTHPSSPSGTQRFTNLCSETLMILKNSSPRRLLQQEPHFRILGWFNALHRIPKEERNHDPPLCRRQH